MLGLVFFVIFAFFVQNSISGLEDLKTNNSCKTRTTILDFLKQQQMELNDAIKLAAIMCLPGCATMTGNEIFPESVEDRVQKIQAFVNEILESIAEKDVNRRCSTYLQLMEKLVEWVEKMPHESLDNSIFSRSYLLRRFFGPEALAYIRSRKVENDSIDEINPTKKVFCPVDQFISGNRSNSYVDFKDFLSRFSSTCSSLINVNDISVASDILRDFLMHYVNFVFALYKASAIARAKTVGCVFPKNIFIKNLSTILISGVWFNVVFSQNICCNSRDRRSASSSYLQNEINVTPALKDALIGLKLITLKQDKNPELLRDDDPMLFTTYFFILKKTNEEVSNLKFCYISNNFMDGGIKHLTLEIMKHLQDCLNRIIKNVSFYSFVINIDQFVRHLYVLANSGISPKPATFATKMRSIGNNDNKHLTPEIMKHLQDCLNLLFLLIYNWFVTNQYWTTIAIVYLFEKRRFVYYRKFIV